MGVPCQGGSDGFLLNTGRACHMSGPRSHRAMLTKGQGGKGWVVGSVTMMPALTASRRAAALVPAGPAMMPTTAKGTSNDTPAGGRGPRDRVPVMLPPFWFSPETTTLSAPPFPSWPEGPRPESSPRTIAGVESATTWTSRDCHAAQARTTSAALKLAVPDFRAIFT